LEGRRWEAALDLHLDWHVAVKEEKGDFGIGTLGF
jgi:hypothetical protein